MKFQNNILFALLSLSSVAVNEKSSLSIFVSADTNSSVCQSILDSNPKASACVEAASGTAFFGKSQTNDDGIKVDAFKGIKYADFQDRFDPSEVLSVQDGDKINATEFGAACAQPPGEIPTGSLEEHCLNLNIWKPINAEEDGAGDLLPVMVYIHGGSFVTGANSLALYNGANIVGNENVVVVSINYRLGVFGYMPTDSKGTGTMNGILDQIEALRWVQNNIEMFGGDPKLVTIFGESAGAGSVVMLSVIPRAKGLFQRAIGESAYDVYDVERDAYTDLDDVLNATKCPKPPCTISFLKDSPAGELMNVTASVEFGQAFDPAVLPTIPSILYSEGAINPTDMIVGSNTFDDFMVVGLSSSDYITMAEGGIEDHVLGFDMFNITTPDEIEAALDAYSWDKFNGSSVLAMAQFVGDGMFTCPLRDMAVSAATSGFDGNMFVYHFGHLSKYDDTFQNGLVTAANITDPTYAGHASELPFVFGNTVTKIPFSDKEKKLSREMMSRWASFARSGNPNLSDDESDSEWFPVSTSNAPGIVAADPRYMRFTIDGGAMVESDREKMEQCAAILLHNPLFDHANKNPQQNLRDERPCLAECKMEERCSPPVPPSEVEVCAETEVCTFEVGRDELSSELGYFEFKGIGGDTCPGTNPVLGIKKGATYLFTQRRTGNYYHPLGFAYGADGALDEQPELEPGICPGTVKGEEDTTDCDCKETGLCPAPMYYTSNNYLGEYSNNPYLAPIQQSEDFGLDAYEPQFFYPLLQWKGTPKEEDPTGPGYYQVALHFPEDTEYTGDFFYFCHIHQFMTGRFKFVDEDGLSISPDNTLRIPYEYQEPDAYDRSCGATGISESQLPDDECPTTFVCDAPDSAVAPFAAKFAECVDSMNCAMLKGITTKISSDSPIALFNHQMIPHHQQAVNMCKALDVAQGTQCEDIFDENKPECVLKVLCQEIINVQNAQIQTMRDVLAQLEYPETDNCVVEIPVDPKEECEENSGSTGYSWCELTQTCVPPGDDACLEAECEENSIVTGKHWCALTRTCFAQGDKSCDKAYCELDSGSTGYSWCTLTSTCVAPGDDACLIAECEQNSGSTGYYWCVFTRTCAAPGDDFCDKAFCEQNSGSTGYSWCTLTQTCIPPSERCELTLPPSPIEPKTFAPSGMPTMLTRPTKSSKSSKISKSRRHRRRN